MDFHLVSIGLIFLILFLLEQFEKYEHKGEEFTINSLDLRNDINLNKLNVGSYPAIPLCNSCELEDVVTDPYLHSNDLGDQFGDLNGKVGRLCGSGPIGKNYNDLNKPVLVAGRSAGRTRQCRRIL